MCGIAGIIDRADLVQEKKLKALAAVLSHRGPDDEGIKILPLTAVNQAVGLVHRRLAIIDLSPAGHQPMQDPSTGNWLTFNGEIYNYRELRQELEKRGSAFVSESDTEVILKAYAVYGEACVKKFRGMFAFALWNVRDQKLFFAVDHFGIKPFYFYRGGGALAFASELKALLKSGIAPFKINPSAVTSFLSFGAVQAPATMVEDVAMLLPGQCGSYDPVLQSLEIKSYWTPRPHQDGRSFEELLEDSVRHHLIADVPVALFLSGGIDSSALAILVNRVAGRSLDSFSVTFEEQDYAEGKYARLVGEKFCARHHELTLRDHDMDRLLPEALTAMDQPTVDGINAFVISRAVHEAGIKVVLSGQGGDEVFGGYPTFRRIPKMLKWFKLIQLAPRPLRQTFLSRFVSSKWATPTRTKFAQYLASDGQLLDLYSLQRQLFSTEYIRTNLLLDKSKQISAMTAGAAAWLLPEISSLNIFNALSFLELRGYLGNMLLRDGDVMSMAHSLEVRVPFLDRQLVEHVFTVSSKEKMRGRIAKPLLVGAVQKELPRAIYDRKKMGFTFPWEYWLRTRLRSRVESMIQEFPADNLLGLDVAACRSLWQQFLARKNGVSWSRVWTIYVLMYWTRRYGP